MTPREIYALIRCCNYIHNISRQYKDWIRNDAGIVGFWGHINSNLGKDKKMARIKEWCKERHLPLEIIDDPTHLTRFKMKIIKDGQATIQVHKGQKMGKGGNESLGSDVRISEPGNIISVPVTDGSKTNTKR